MAQKFDALIIGIGQAGPALAPRLDKEGLKVALVEHGKFGGVNDGCTPARLSRGHRIARED
jgi:pyruvate/2-oxoglutarate dehydrogenase complex dihydrolipoamide dehydrogenase (E3) component